MVNKSIVHLDFHHSFPTFMSFEQTEEKGRPVLLPHELSSKRMIDCLHCKKVSLFQSEKLFPYLLKRLEETGVIGSFSLPIFVIRLYNKMDLE